MHDARIPEHDLSHGVLLSLYRIGHARSCCLNFPQSRQAPEGFNGSKRAGAAYPAFLFPWRLCMQPWEALMRPMAFFTERDTDDSD